METQGFSHVITDRGGWSYKGLTDSLRDPMETRGLVTSSFYYFIYYSFIG